MGADIKAHDPYVRHWWELEKQDTYPAVGGSRSRFFRNQEQLNAFSMTPDLAEALKGSDAVVLAVRHQEYLHLDPDEVVRMIGEQVGRGHINRIKDKVRKRKLAAKTS
jgi:UDP-N-acetyl-D-mannosaminuronate dehydrogenase